MLASPNITARDVQKVLDQWVLAADATTADGAQQKKFHVKTGEQRFMVERRYLEGDDRGWQTIYWHTDFQGAIDAYNDLG
jgi:hypothetical protein